MEEDVGQEVIFTHSVHIGALLELAHCYILRWSFAVVTFFFVTLHNCVDIIEYYIIIVVIIIVVAIGITRYLYVYVDFVKFFSPT
jgi:hypothetical protein